MNVSCVSEPSPSPSSTKPDMKFINWLWAVLAVSLLLFMALYILAIVVFAI